MTAATEHVDAFNTAVETGDWDAFAQRFAPDARMTFVNAPVDPVVGREAIAAAYHANPPAEPMKVIADEGDSFRYQWVEAGGTGRVELSWSPDGQIQELTITFD